MRSVFVWTAFAVVAASRQHELRGKQSTRHLLQDVGHLHRQAKARSKFVDEGASNIDGPDLDDDKPKKHHPTLKSSDDSQETGPTGSAPTDEVVELEPIEDDPPKSAATSFVESDKPDILLTPPVPPIPPSSSGSYEQSNSVENAALDDIPTYSPTEWPTYSPVEVATTTTSTSSVSTTVENETEDGFPTYSPTEWTTYSPVSSSSYQISPTYGPTQPWPTYSPLEVETTTSTSTVSTIQTSGTSIATTSTSGMTKSSDATVVNQGTSSAATSAETTSAVTTAIAATETSETSSSTASALESTVSSTSNANDVLTTVVPETPAASTITSSTIPTTKTSNVDSPSTVVTTTVSLSSVKSTEAAVTTEAISGTVVTPTSSAQFTGPPNTSEPTTTTIVSKSSFSSSTTSISTTAVDPTEPPETATTPSSAFEQEMNSSNTSATSTSLTITSMFGVSTQHPSGCSSSCGSELCACIINNVEEECMPLLVAECTLDSQSDCLSGIFGDFGAASVFCDSAICLASGKSEWECRCEFVADLCDMDSKLEFQCEQAECCDDAASDNEMEECFIGNLKSDDYSTSALVSTAPPVKSTTTAELTTTAVATSPPFSSEVYKCSNEYCQYDLADDFLLKYKVNTINGTVEIELLYDGVAWLGLALSKNGGMVGSEAVIGIPDGSIPQKYYLGGKDVSTVLPMESEKQTLIDASIEIVDDQTIMKFTKLIQESDEIGISTGGNDFLWAHGYGATLGYHQSRSPFKINLLEIKDEVDVVASTVTVSSTIVTTSFVSTESSASNEPTVSPTLQPVTNPTNQPSEKPTQHPTAAPTKIPTPKPSSDPTASPTLVTHCPPQYNASDATYTAGHRIEAGGYVYECKPYPHSLYCSQSEFQPISDEDDEVEKELWLNAWERLGPCIKTEPPTALPTTEKPTTNPTATPTLDPIFQPTMPPTTNPTMKPTLNPTMKPTHKPSTKPTVKPTEAPTTKPTMKPTHKPSTKPTVTPTQVPTTKPSVKPTAKQTTSGPTDSTTGLSSYLQEVVQRFPYPYPHVRFTQWAELSDDEKSVAKSLSYTRYLWDNLEIASIESYPYDHLSQTEQQGVGALGLDAEMWDCYVNHYYGYYWDELEEAGVAQYYSGLGWTKASWEEGAAAPAIEDLYWNELSETEKNYAINLCYFEYSWNWIGLDDW